MQMIGVSTAQADDAFGTGKVSGFEVFDELEPFVATDQRVDLVEAQDGDFDAGAFEPVEINEVEGGFGEPVGRRKKHWRLIELIKSPHSSRSKDAFASKSNRRTAAPTLDLCCTEVPL